MLYIFLKMWVVLGQCLCKNQMQSRVFLWGYKGVLIWFTCLLANNPPKLTHFINFINDALIVYNRDSKVKNACVPEYVLDLMVYTRFILFICKEGENASLCKCGIPFRPLSSWENVNLQPATQSGLNILWTMRISLHSGEYKCDFGNHFCCIHTFSNWTSVKADLTHSCLTLTLAGKSIILFSESFR